MDDLITRLRNITDRAQYARAVERLINAHEQLGNRLLTDADLLLINAETDNRLADVAKQVRHE